MKILRYIKNILIIACLSLSLLSSISKCHAYSYGDLLRFIDACIENNITSSVLDLRDLQYVKDNIYKITNYINNNNIDISQYTSFAIRGVDLNKFEVWFYKDNVLYGGANNGTSAYMDVMARNGDFYINTNNYKGNITSNTWYDLFQCGIFVNNPPYGDSNVSRCLTQQKWDPNQHPAIPPFDYTPYGILSNDDWYYQKFAYTGNICLGKLGVNDFYQLDINFKNPNGVKLGTISFVPGVGSIDDNRSYFFT